MIELAKLGEAIADYEAEFGEISEEEMSNVREADRQGAVVVGPPCACSIDSTQTALAA